MSKSICVFCGARMGNNPAFEQAARDLGNVLAKNTWRLVYGAGDIGLMVQWPMARRPLALPLLA